MKNYTVILPWAWSGDPSDEEGTYCIDVRAEDEEAAKLACATEMADSGARFFDDDEERQEYIDHLTGGWADVSTNLVPELETRCKRSNELLAWIVTFCDEHPEWMGNESPDDGAEFEWLDEARTFLRANP